MIIATAFTPNENAALKHLSKSLPYNASFKMAKKPTRLSKKVLSTLKSIFDGKNASSKFELKLRYLSDYAQKVLRCVSMIPVGHVTTYGEIAKNMGGSPRLWDEMWRPIPFLLLFHATVLCGRTSLWETLEGA